MRKLSIVLMALKSMRPKSINHVDNKGGQKWKEHVYYFFKEAFFEKIGREVFDARCQKCDKNFNISLAY